MKIKAAILTAFLAVPAFAQTWTNINAPALNWSCMASSADGSRLVAATSSTQVSTGFVYTSTDSGVTWRSNDLVGFQWSWAASSADGIRLALLGGGGAGNSRIYTSTNAGTNWTPTTAPTTNWHRIGWSADGTRLLAGGEGIFGPGEGQSPTPLHLSTNFGLNWQTIFPAPKVTGLAAVASSQNGMNWIVSCLGNIYTSTNGGLLWTSNNLPLHSFDSVASSADGSRLIAASGILSGGGALFISTDGGANWWSNRDLSIADLSLAASADAMKLVAVDGFGCIYASTDGGTNWVTDYMVSNHWGSPVCSADGAKAWAISGLGGITTNGIYTRQVAPAPVLKLAPSGPSNTLFWIWPSSAFVLQKSPDITTTSWSAVPDTPGLNLTNLQFQLNLPASDPYGFYRLAK